MNFRINQLIPLLIMMNTIILFSIIGGCSGSKPDSIGVIDNRLADCPDSPNCISTTASDAGHQVPYFQLTGNSAELWPKLIKVVSDMDRTTIVTQTDTYIHAECRSRVFRFVDDLEILLSPETGQVAVRSASRLGRSDFGVNRKRYDTLQQQLSQEGIILAQMSPTGDSS